MTATAALTLDLVRSGQVDSWATAS